MSKCKYCDKELKQTDGDNLDTKICFGCWKMDVGKRETGGKNEK